MNGKLVRRGNILASALAGVLVAAGIGYAAIPSSSDGVIHGWGTLARRHRGARLALKRSG